MSNIRIDSCSLRVSDDVVFRELDGEAVILNLESGIYFGLDKVGTRIWQLVEEHRDLRTVLGALEQEYDAPAERLEQDLIGLVSSFLEKGLMTAAGDRAES
jgi:hypothetical protein